MNLTDIIDKIDYIDYTKNNDDEITNVTNDSRKIEKGGVFVAISGMEFDGHKFIDKAIENGANTIVVTQDTQKIEGINYIKVEDARIALAQISNVVCDFPSMDTVHLLPRSSLTNLLPSPSVSKLSGSV